MLCMLAVSSGARARKTATARDSGVMRLRCRSNRWLKVERLRLSVRCVQVFHNRHYSSPPFGHIAGGTPITTGDLLSGATSSHASAPYPPADST